MKQFLICLTFVLWGIVAFTGCETIGESGGDSRNACPTLYRVSVKGASPGGILAISVNGSCGYPSDQITVVSGDCHAPKTYGTKPREYEAWLDKEQSGEAPASFWAKDNWEQFVPIILEVNGQPISLLPMEVIQIFGLTKEDTVTFRLVREDGPYVPFHLSPPQWEAEVRAQMAAAPP
jgi:hypothetical protein